MTEDQLDEEYDSIEYALKHLSLIVNEDELYDLENFLEDLNYWKREKLENRQLELESYYEDNDEFFTERDLVYQDMRYEQELDRRWGI